MASADKRKQSLYFPEEMLKEIQDEANRQDRSLSWIVQQAWRIARSEIKRFPSVNDVLDTPAAQVLARGSAITGVTTVSCDGVSRGSGLAPGRRAWGSPVCIAPSRPRAASVRANFVASCRAAAGSGR